MLVQNCSIVCDCRNTFRAVCVGVRGSTSSNLGAAEVSKLSHGLADAASEARHVIAAFSMSRMFSIVNGWYRRLRLHDLNLPLTALDSRPGFGRPF